MTSSKLMMSLAAITSLIAKISSVVMQANGIVSSVQSLIPQKTLPSGPDGKIKKIQDEVKKLEEIVIELSKTVQALAEELQSQAEITRRLEERLRLYRWVSFLALAFSPGALVFTFIR